MTIFLAIFLIFCTNYRHFSTYAQFGKSGDEYCDSNRAQFGNECNNRFSDNGQNDFCSSYGVRCRGWQRASLAVQQPPAVAQNNPPPQQPPVIVQNNPRPQPQVVAQPQPKPQTYRPQNNPRQHVKPPKSTSSNLDNEAYCKAYGKEYYALCLRGNVPDFASSFCNGFSESCPGVPKPGSLVGSPVKPVVTSPQFQPAPNNLPPALPISQQPVPLSSMPLVPANPGLTQPVVNPALQPSPVLPANSLSSLPSSPSLPSGGLPSLPSSPSLPSGGLPSLPAANGLAGSPALNPAGGFNPGGPTPGGIGLGQSVNAPFFGGQSGTNISPLSGVGTGTGLNAAGMGVGASQGVNFGSLPGLSALNQAGGLGGIGGKRRRRRRRETFARSLQSLMN